MHRADPLRTLSLLRQLRPEHEAPSRRAVLQSLGLVAGGLALGCRPSAEPGAEGTTEAPAPDVVQPAPGFPPPRFIETNGIRMGVYELGEGTPVVFCHGFPELAYSWRNQINPFRDAGYRVIVPDQRGYGLTDRPEAVEEYTLAKLCGDQVGLLDALGIERAVFVGHDWGGGVVWMMPRLYPERVAGVIGVNTPASDPRPENRVEPAEKPLIVRSERYYTVTFQEPGVADAALARDVRRTFELIMRRGGIWDVEAFAALPEDSPERRMDLLTMLEQGDFQGELLLTEEELAYYVQTYEITGFTGGLNWYRAAGSIGLGADPAQMTWDIGVPCLYVGAEDDVILRPSRALGMERFIADFEHHTIADCGHWTQQEKPEELNRLALDWLGRKIGKV